MNQPIQSLNPAHIETTFTKLKKEAQAVRNLMESKEWKKPEILSEQIYNSLCYFEPWVGLIKALSGISKVHMNRVNSLVQRTLDMSEVDIDLSMSIVDLQSFKLIDCADAITDIVENDLKTPRISPTPCKDYFPTEIKNPETDNKPSEEWQKSAQTDYTPLLMRKKESRDVKPI